MTRTSYPTETSATGPQTLSPILVALLWGAGLGGCSDTSFVDTAKQRIAAAAQSAGALPSESLPQTISRPTCRLLASSLDVLSGEAVDLRIEQDSGATATAFRMISAGVGIATSSTHRVNPISTATVEGFATNGGGESSCGFVTIRLTPTVISKDPSVVCNLSADKASVTAGESVRFTINQTAGDAATSYRYVNGSQNSGTAATLTLQPESDITLTAFSANASGESSCGTLTVNVTPVTIVAPTCTISANSLSVNSGSNVVLTITQQSGNPATSYAMTVSPSPSIIATTAIHSLSITETKTIHGFAGNAAGRVSCGHLTVIVTPADTPRDPAVVCSVTADAASITRGDPVRFTINQTAGDPATGFKITSGNAVIATTAITDYVPLAAGTFIARGYALNPSSATHSDCGTVSVQVEPLAVPACSLKFSNTSVPWTGGNSSITITPTNGSVVARKALFRVAASGGRTDIAEGSQSIMQTTTFFGQVENISGSNECTGTVSIEPPPDTACVLRASANPVLLGKSVTLSVVSTPGAPALTATKITRVMGGATLESALENWTFNPTANFIASAKGTSISGTKACTPASLEVKVLNPLVSLTVTNTANAGMPTNVPTVTATTGQTQTILKHHNTPITLAWSAADVTSCVMRPGALIPAPVSTNLTGSATIPDSAFSGNRTFQILCQSAFGPRQAKVTVNFPGRWYNAYKAQCPTFCAGRTPAMTNVGSPFPEEHDNACASGETWSPALLNIGVLKFPNGRWGGGGGIRGRSVGERCYTTNQKRDNDNTDFTTGCFCK